VPDNIAPAEDVATLRLTDSSTALGCPALIVDAQPLPA
jgi:hypothetical protein